MSGRLTCAQLNISNGLPVCSEVQVNVTGMVSKNEVIMFSMSRIKCGVVFHHWDHEMSLLGDASTDGGVDRCAVTTGFVYWVVIKENYVLVPNTTMCVVCQ